MIPSSGTRIPFSIAGIFGALCLWTLIACTNDPDQVKAVGKSRDLPTEWANDVEILYSDSGAMRVFVTAPRLEKYYNGKERYTLMPKGIDARFFDSARVEKSSIIAGYAVEYPDKKLIEARNNVQVVNELGDTLNTEYLVWNRNTRIISTEASVRIITHENEVIFGENGMEADERFTRWRIRNIKQSTLLLKEDKE